MTDVGVGLSITDPVTGAFSRALFASRAEAELSRAVRNRTSCSLFLFDLDYFKSVNDSYGHQRGDEVLRQVVERVQGLVRDYDELFRYGGDEFVLLLPDTSRADAVRLAMAVVDGVGGPDLPGTPPLRVTVSLGVASHPDDGTDVASLLACADRRNYLAKARGRDCAVADDAETATAATSSRLLERESALAALNDLLTRLDTTEGSGEAFVVSGGRGAGQTRFLAEAGRVARVRGFEVLRAGDPDATVPAGTDRLLITADTGEARAAAALVGRLRPLVRTVGLVYADPHGPVDVGLPQGPGIELLPWSVGALRVWLRSTLRGEPSQRLITHLHGRSGGLPGLVHHELDQLRESGGLRQSAAGDWTVTPETLGRARRWAARPAPATELVGRVAERDRVVGLLATSRLVTLAGPGGIGKTRLSLAVADVVAGGGLASAGPASGGPASAGLASAGPASGGLVDGAVFVPLGELSSTELVVEAIAAAVGAEAVPGRPLLDAVADRLADASVLLVLDNFEQVLDAALVVGELMRRAPGIRVLATSRERLSLYGEQVYQVPPLPLPEAGAMPAGPGAVRHALLTYPALALFDQRARAADADFAVTAGNLAAIGEVCRRLDGLPLAIELAAARADRWSPELLLTHLGRHLDALDEGPRDLPARQRTLRGAIDWSVVLLPPADQSLFARLAVFTGGCTADAAAAVVGEAADLPEMALRLDSLVRKNLLVLRDDDDGGRRFAMLETIRSYALELLTARTGVNDAGAQDVWIRHAGYFGDLAERAAESLVGPQQAAETRRLDREYPNLRTAFGTGMRHGDVPACVRFCRSLWPYWWDGQHLTEGRQWCAQTLALAPGDAPDAELLYISAVLAHCQDDHDAAQSLAERSLEAYLRIGDRLGTARAHSALGMAAFTSGDYTASRHHHGKSLDVWRELGHLRGIGVGLGNLARTALRTGDVAAAEEHVAQRQQLGGAEETPRDSLLALEDHIEIALARADASRARLLLADSLRLSRELHDGAGEALALHQLGVAALLDGRPAEAARLFADALARRHTQGLHEDISMSLEGLAAAAAGTDGHLAAELLGAAAGLRERHRLPEPPCTDAARERTAAVAGAALGEAGFAQALAAGRSAPLDLVVERARDAVR